MVSLFLYKNATVFYIGKERGKTMKAKMTAREWLPLIGMTVAAFIFNTSEFMPIGLLTDIAQNYHITEAHAGQLITVYSWVVMLLSLPLMLLVCKIPYKTLLLGTMALFGGFQFLSTAAMSYGILMVARIGVACAHAVFWSIASPIAVKLVREEHRSFALSMIVTGTSLATIAGLPLGRIIGLYLSWRVTFLFVGVIAMFLVVYIIVLFPKMESGTPFEVKQLPELLKRPGLIGVYIQTFLFVLAYYTSYSYIEPFLKQVAKLSDQLVTVTLLLFGAAGLLGSFLFSKLYDKNRMRFIGTVMISLVVLLGVLAAAAQNSIFIIGICILWGIVVMAFNVTFQSETIRNSSEEASSIAMSIYSGIFNFGIGCGTFAGGLVCTKASIGMIGYAGGIFALVSALFFLFGFMRLGRE